MLHFLITVIISFSTTFEKQQNKMIAELSGLQGQVHKQVIGTVTRKCIQDMNTAPFTDKKLHARLSLGTGIHTDSHKTICLQSSPEKHTYTYPDLFSSKNKVLFRFSRTVTKNEDNEDENTLATNWITSGRHLPTLAV